MRPLLSLPILRLLLQFPITLLALLAEIGFFQPSPDSPARRRSAKEGSVSILSSRSMVQFPPANERTNIKMALFHHERVICKRTCVSDDSVRWEMLHPRRHFYCNEMKFAHLSSPFKFQSTSFVGDVQQISYSSHARMHGCVSFGMESPSSTD